MRFRFFLQHRVQVAGDRHFPVPAGIVGIKQAVVIVGDAFAGVGLDEGFIQDLGFLIGHIPQPQAEKDVQCLKLCGQDGPLQGRTVQNGAAAGILAADLHEIDGVRAAGAKADERAVHRLAHPVKFMAFQRRNDVDRDPAQTEPMGDELGRKGLAGAGGAHEGNAAVFVDSGIEVVERDQRIVVLVDAQQHAALVAQFVADQRVTGRRAGSEHIAVVFFEQMRVDLAQRQSRQKCSFLSEPAELQGDVLRKAELAQFVHPPLQVLGAGGRHRYQDGGKIQVFAIGQAVFEEIARADRPGQVVKVSVGVAGILDLAAVEADLLADLLDHPLLGLTFEEQIHVDAFAGVDQQVQPSGRDLGAVSVGRDHQVGVIQPVHADIFAVLEVHRRRDQKGVGRDIVERGGVLPGKEAGQHILDAVGQGAAHGGAAVEQVVEYFGDEFIFVFMLDDVVAALTQIGTEVARSRLQHRDDLGIRYMAFVDRVFILKNDKEPAADRVARTKPRDKTDIVFMVGDDGGVRFPGFVRTQPREIGVDGGFLRHRFDLQFDRRDLEHTGKCLDDISLFPRRAQQKVDGLDLQNLEIAAVGGCNNAVFDLGDRQQVIQRLAAGQFAGDGAAFAHGFGAFG